MGGRFFVKRVNEFPSNGRMNFRQMGEFKFFFVTLHPVKAINMKMTYCKALKQIFVVEDSEAYRREDGIYVVPIGCLKD